MASVAVQAGLIVKAAAWALDPAACAGMQIGAPRVTPAALSALHDLLAAQGLREGFSGERIVIEERAMKSLLPPPDLASELRQLSMLLPCNRRAVRRNREEIERLEDRRAVADVLALRERGVVGRDRHGRRDDAVSRVGSQPTPQRGCP